MDLLNLFTSPPGIMILAASATVFFICLAAIGRSRRTRKFRRAKEQARECLMHARRAARSPREADRVPGLVRRIRHLADQIGFELHDVGASRRGLEKLLMMAKDKAQPRPAHAYQNIGPVGLALAYERLALPGPTKPAHELELELPADDGVEEDLVITRGSTEAVTAQSPDAFGNSLEIEVELPELGPEVITSYLEPTAPAPVQTADQDRTDDEDDVDVDALFDRIIIPDDESDGSDDIDAMFDRIVIKGGGIDANAKIIRIVKRNA